ncbi:hypothetical protein HYZ99_01595 [Candidatus Peregrinibacteria bacterium]|nr:hypothetical protein [Candidatus Peregrinibacteria bacterium]
MSKFLHQLAAVLFYLVGASFFAAYIFLRNDIGPQWAAWWMQVADIPFIAVSIVYGGLSLYLSVSGSGSKLLPWLIGVPLAVVFVVLVIFNFWLV